jgi:flavin reductase (DIM6/NTAB) family NADH-FMN oxidoreductase RutF
MFFHPDKGDMPLKYSPFKAIVAPRPIGWISTISKNGDINLAPYSFFNAIASHPDLVMFSSQEWKDSVENVSQTGEFVCNYVSASMTDAMNVSSTSAPAGVNEFELAGLEQVPSQTVKPPRVKGVAAALECKKTEIIELKDHEGKSINHFMVIGQVMGIYIDDTFITDGRFDVGKARPITRLGYKDYQGPGEIFELGRPSWKPV